MAGMTTLPDWIPALPSLELGSVWPDSCWDRFRLRLDALGIDEGSLRRYDFLGPDLGDALRLPLQQWAARQEGTLAALAIAFLRLGEPLSWSEVQQVLGGDIAKAMRDSGLLTAGGADQFCFGLRLGALDSRLILSDRNLFHPDSVMGASAATSRVHVAAGVGSSAWGEDASLLDLGCGGGALALALAPLASRVVGSDISTRAIALARVNARLNGLADGSAAPQFRCGDLFEPVEGQRFSRLVCQPPFLPEAGAAATFATGGPRGDGITLRILRQLSRFLRPDGRAVLCVEWAGGNSLSWQQRVEDALADHPWTAIHFELFRTPMADHCTLLAPYLCPPSSPDYGAYLKNMLNHYQAAGIEWIDLVMHVLEPADSGTALQALRHVPLESLDHLTAGFADIAIQALRLSAATEAELLDSQLHAPAGFQLLQPGSDAGEAIEVTFAAEALLPRGQLPAIAAAVLEAAGNGTPARDILRLLPLPSEQAVTLLRQLLAQGLLFAGSPQNRPVPQAN